MCGSNSRKGRQIWRRRSGTLSGGCSVRGRGGNAPADSLFLIVILFVFVIVTLFANTMMSELNTEMQADDVMTVEAKAEMSERSTNMPTTFDYAVAMAFGALWLGAILASLLIDAHPAFLMLSVIVVLLLLFVPPNLANMYETTITELGTASSFPISTFIFQHLMQYYIAVVFTVMLVLYGKSR